MMRNLLSTLFRSVGRLTVLGLALAGSAFAAPTAEDIANEAATARSDHADVAQRVDEMPFMPNRLREPRPMLEDRHHPAVAPLVAARILEQEDEAAARKNLTQLVFINERPDLLHRILLSDPDEQVRAAAATHLRSAPAEVRIPALSAALEDRSSKVRNAAARAAAHGEDDALARRLLDHADDPDPEVRASVAWSLGVLEATEAISRLEAGLGDAEADVRLESLRAMHRIDPERAASHPAVPRLAEDANPRLSRFATRLRDQE